MGLLKSLVVLCYHQHKNHTHYSGKVENGKMILNDLGAVVEKCWNNIPIHFTIVELDYFVLMPNHIHGILILNEQRRDGINCVSTNRNNGGIKGVYNPQLNPNSVSNIIRQFKARCTIDLRKLMPDFSWQPRFYDRIIRNEKELYNIRKYIEQNPLKWELKKDTPENIC